MQKGSTIEISEKEYEVLQILKKKCVSNTSKNPENGESVAPLIGITVVVIAHA